MYVTLLLPHTFVVQLTKLIQKNTSTVKSCSKKPCMIRASMKATKSRWPHRKYASVTV